MLLSSELIARKVDSDFADRMNCFTALTTGHLVLGANRRGKYLWLPLDSGDAVLAHLGMSGQLLVRPPDAN